MNNLIHCPPILSHWQPLAAVPPQHLNHNLTHILKQAPVFCLSVATLEQLHNEKNYFLNKEEKDYLATLEFEKRQHSYLLGRYAAKQAITAYSPNLDPVNFFIKPGIFEQPIVYYPDPHNVHNVHHVHNIQVSLTHAESFSAALAFSEATPMGIDLEMVQLQHQTAIESQLTPNELEWIQHHYHRYHPNSSQMVYTLHWCLKEALSKALRTGLTTPFDLFEIKNLVQQPDHWTAEFQHFAQYQGIAFLLDYIVGPLMCAIVYPKQISLSLDFKAIFAWMQTFTRQTTRQTTRHRIL